MSFMPKLIPIASQSHQGDQNSGGCCTRSESVSQLRNPEFRKPSILQGGCQQTCLIFSRKEKLPYHPGQEANLSCALEGDVSYTNICANRTNASYSEDVQKCEETHVELSFNTET